MDGQYLRTRIPAIQDGVRVSGEVCFLNKYKLMILHRDAPYGNDNEIFTLNERSQNREEMSFF